MSSSFVLDTSALLAIYNNEPGAAEAQRALDNSVISTVNASEMMGKLIEWGVPVQDALESFADFNIPQIAFDEDQARIAAELVLVTKRAGVSLGDRACLALGRTTGFTVLTTDRAWKTLQLGINIRVLRG